MRQSSHPLDGITVLDFGQVYNGPYASFLLAMAGARVIKIEPPSGEPLRRRAGITGGLVPFAMLNNNKESVTLNLKHERGRDLLRKLVVKADVLLENFAPRVMDSLGVGPESLRALNPRLVYASGSGYGREGARRNDLAMDLTIQAVSGMMHCTGFPDGPPVKSGPATADFISGSHLYGAILTGLFERERTGKGKLVEVAMLDAVIPTLASNMGQHFGNIIAGNEQIDRTGNRHSGMSVAPFNVYSASDGYVAIIAVSDVHWKNLVVAMGCEELADDPRFITNKARVDNIDEVDALIAKWVATMTKAEAWAIAQRYKIPTASVRDMDELVNDEHLHQRGMLQWIDHPDPEIGRYAAIRSPIRVHGTAPMTLKQEPPIGFDNTSIYGDWLGLDQKEITSLHEDGAI